jgi:hypothetical protein
MQCSQASKFQAPFMCLNLPHWPKTYETSRTQVLRMLQVASLQRRDVGTVNDEK